MTLREQGRENAEHFVGDALLPFLDCLRIDKSPSVEEVAALIWGYQSGSEIRVSPFAVAAILREKISEEEKGPKTIYPETRHMIEAMQLVSEAVPHIAAKYMYSPKGNRGGSRGI